MVVGLCWDLLVGDTQSHVKVWFNFADPESFLFIYNCTELKKKSLYVLHSV